MSTTIEQLELEVKSNASSTVSGIDALASSLDKLKNATKGGCGLDSVSKQFTTLNTALNNISQANIKKMSYLGQALGTLSSASNFKLSPSVASQITNLGAAVRSLSGTNFSSLNSLVSALTPLSTIGKSNLNSFISQLQRLPQAVQALNSVNMSDLSSKVPELVSALSQLSNMGKNNLTSFITQLNKIPKLAEDLKNVDFRTLYNQIQSLVRVFTPLATQMEKISAGFAAFPTRIQKLIASTNNLSASNYKTSRSYIKQAASIGINLVAMKQAGSVLASFINKSNQYIENLNLFNASMGEYASSAQEYAEQVGELVGIDPGEWMRNQGVFMTLATGFGVASDRAYTMSQNLTQLGYDISSFFNISFEDSMLKLQSGLAGELEPLRRIGYDLSVARLQQEAYNLGITESVSAMTQAEKAELRYYAIMTQVTTVQGDMARTLAAPANQLRILQAQVEQCARAIGNIFIPILNAVLPYLIAVAKVIKLVASTLANLFGFSLPEVDYSGLSSSVSSVADSAEDVSSGLGDATKNAKKLKNALLGIDELNVLSQNNDSSSGSGSGSGSSGIGGESGSLGIDLPTYNFLDDIVATKLDTITQKMKDWLGITDDIDSWSELFETRLGKILLTVTATGTGFAAWKVANNIIPVLDKLKSLKGLNLTFTSIGLLGLLSDLNEFSKFFRDFMENGASLQNVTGMLSEFTGAVGDIMILLGQMEIGGALKVVQGVGEITSAVKDIADSGVNWENANTAIRGLTNIAIGIGMFTGNLNVVGWGLAIQGFTSIITEIGSNWDAIKQGDWSGVDKVTIIIGTLEVLGGLAVALDVFSKLKEIAGMGKASEKIKEVTTATETLDTEVSTKLSPNLTSLAKNLGLGVVIIGEVAVAAGLIVGSIILLGEGLAQVGDSWQPVIDNASTVAIAVGVGTVALTAVGVVTATLGSVGTSLASNIAIGTAILAELGIAAGLFIVEIWAIGKGLDEIGQAWQPVLDNGSTIATGIGLGTALLVGIGVVTAALGVATVASAGLLPLAIGLGTAILVELTAAFILFTENLVGVANELSNNLSPALDDLNAKLPTLSTNMSNFVDFMTEFAHQVVRYTEVSAIAGISSTIDKIIGWFTEDPIEKLADDVDDIYDQTSKLNDKLELANPELEDAIDLLTSYRTYLSQLEKLTQGNVQLANGIFVNMKEVGQNLVTGFVEGIKSKSVDFTNAATTLVGGFKTQLSVEANSCKKAVTDWASDLKKWFTNSSYGAINETTFKKYAGDVVTGFNNGITANHTTSQSGVMNWATNLKTWFTSSAHGGINSATFMDYAKDTITGFNNGITYNYTTIKIGIETFAKYVKDTFNGITSYSTFYSIAKDVIDGFNKGINDFYTDTKPYMKKWAEAAASAYKAALKSHSPSKRFMEIGEDTVRGYNIGIANLGGTTKDVVTDWANSFSNVSPTMSFAVDTSALKYYNSDSFANAVSADVSSKTTVTATGFKEGMEEFYKEYVSPVLSQMAEDVRRQADKNEQTIVKVGNRTITDAVNTQQKANGYVFVK